MKDFMPDVSPNFLTNKQGKQVGVFLDIKDYELMVERMEDLYLGNIAKLIKSRNEETKTLKELEEELKSQDN